MIIDNHVHVAGPPYNDEILGWPAYDGRVIPTFPSAMPRKLSSPERLIQDMDKFNIDKAIINAINGWVTNQQVSDIIKQYQKRFYGFARVTNPLDQETAPQELENAVKKLGLHGLKLHPGLQGFSPADPKLVPLVEKAAELRVPIFFHTGAWPSGSFDYVNPAHIDVLTHRVPEACIVIGHMGFFRFMDVFAMLQVYDRSGGLYVDTSMGLLTLVDFYGVEFMSKYVRGIVDRVLFGSDWVGDFSRMKNDNLDVIERLDLTREEKDKILGGNAAKLLNI